ncbi:MAG: hypothetical protein COY81_00790 [Candidatus Pacebacteria bacterium CG_4_10_14_0_8_um_filter_43_12]|nr:MAG: hypothetical protein COU66_03365 [Candidatus Pacebacteria bacterium CG10_big_fil_rev_8_21_14_0_10_44_11]PIY79765.1 MAG: hypothetical protein COY81_00790 [Candidatus Pacebacteria bacterium CG_4_10_14_0_8_um_filter_43_12]
MSAKFHSLALLMTIALAYIWLQVPLLRMYSLQIFALFVLAFLVIKRFKKAKLWHILPEWASYEITLLTFAFLLLIGATGNTKSLFFPLGYVNLFFLVMTSYVPTAIIATAAIVLFHYALDPELSVATIQSISTLPIMLAIFLFARKEYDEAHLAKLAAEQAKQLLPNELDPSIQTPINAVPQVPQPAPQPVPQAENKADPLLNSTIAADQAVQNPQQTTT